MENEENPRKSRVFRLASILSTRLGGATRNFGVPPALRMLRTGFCTFCVQSPSNSMMTGKHKRHPSGVFCVLEAPPGIGPGIRVLQTRALPLGHGAIWSGLRGSNPPPRPWQGRALPNELNPQDILFSAVATRMGLEPTTSSVTG